MAKEYQIVENSVVVGRFSKEEDRDNAFETSFINTERSGYKNEE